MAICQIFENPSLTEEQLERIQAHITASGPVPPDGGRLVVGGWAGPVWRAVSVWESPGARDRFLAERLGPAYEAAGLSLDDATSTVFDVHMLVAGDLVGTPQPA